MNAAANMTAERERKIRQILEISPQTDPARAHQALDRHHWDVPSAVGSLFDPAPADQPPAQAAALHSSNVGALLDSTVGALLQPDLGLTSSQRFAGTADAPSIDVDLMNPDLTLPTLPFTAADSTINIDQDGSAADGTPQQTQEERDVQKAIEASMKDQRAHTIDSPVGVRTQGMPTGLNNTNNSCFLNSIIQTYFHYNHFLRAVLALKVGVTRSKNKHPRTSIDVNSAGSRDEGRNRGYVCVLCTYVCVYVWLCIYVCVVRPVERPY